MGNDQKLRASCVLHEDEFIMPSLKISVKAQQSRGEQMMSSPWTAIIVNQHSRTEFEVKYMVDKPSSKTLYLSRALEEAQI